MVPFINQPMENGNFFLLEKINTLFLKVLKNLLEFFS